VTKTIPDFPATRLTIAESEERLDATELLEIWRRMVWIRENEMMIERLNGEGLIRGSTHLCIGMEACAVGAVSALSKHDVVLGHYRGHGHALAVGMSPRRVMSEVLGRQTGCNGGRGGTKHLMDVSRNHLGAYAIVGQHMPLATGIAIGLRLAAAAGRRPPSIVACISGDGAANAGATLEAWNLAVINKLPVVFICENNLYAVSTPSAKVTGGESIAARAAGFGMAAEKVDGMDALAVREAVLNARAHALADGPAFLELETYRYRAHSVFQIEDHYRTEEEVDAWKARDAIAQMEARLAAVGVPAEDLSDEREAIRARLREDAEWVRQQEPAGHVSEDDMFATAVSGLDEWGLEA
jgi:TPP-dependent pyruvate/acetoin dehydrogenase alpha subunit